MSNEAMTTFFFVLWLGGVVLITYLNILVLYAVGKLKEKLDEASPEDKGDVS